MTELIDNYQRKINYLRVSITDRCNLRCQYCMPPAGVEAKEHDDILRYEEIIKIVRTGVDMGITKVRVTGGEPLVRRGILDLISGLNAIEGLTDISMTTNGTLLAEKASALKKAGLNRVNISLDSLQPEKFKEITRRDNFEQARAGIMSALDAGLLPVKINVVVMRNINDDEILDFVQLSREHPLQVRFIEFMPLGDVEQLQSEKYISLNEIREVITEKYEITPITATGNGPATYYQVSSYKNTAAGDNINSGKDIKDINAGKDESFKKGKDENGAGIIGFINPISHKFCSQCNRLRLTADGRLKPCLASNIEVDMHNKNGQIGETFWIKGRFRKALSLKPGCHNFSSNEREKEGKDINAVDDTDESRKKLQRNMSQIGG